MAGRWVVLELEGDLATSGFRTTLEIQAENEPHALKVKGFLPPNPGMLAHLHRHWQDAYRPLGMPLRIKGHKIIHKGFINQRLVDCQQSAQVLCKCFQTWLNSESFQPIDRRLREELSRDDTIRLLIRTQNVDVQKLPWHEWDFFDRYPYAEMALSTPEYEAVRPSVKSTVSHPVRILAILGHSHGINIEADQRLLAGLPQADVSFLVEPDRQQLNDRLWETPWDILFFAGHSETYRDQGRIFINPTDSLTLSELRYGLRKAIDQGLQLAIFNSCDGLGLVQALQQLSIPQMIVMREPVIDQVAEAFLKYFLEAFAHGESLYLSARQARERLQGLEHQYPCASWLPVIYQNFLTPPPDWHTLQGKPAALPAAPTASHRFNWLQPVWLSLVVTIMVLIVQHLGWLQPYELAAYDHLLRSRPAETIDSRILLVEVNETDLDELGGYPLSDAVLAQTVDVLQEFEPVAIAFDMHRFRPRGTGRQALIDQFRQHSNLFTVCAYDMPGQDYGSPPEFSDEQQISQVGFSDFLLDSPLQISQGQPNAVATALTLQQVNNVVRRHLISYSPALVSTRPSCATPYSLSFQLAYRYLSQAGVTPLKTNENNHWQFGAITLRPLSRRFAAYQNLDGLSSQLMLNYRAAQPGQAVSLDSVLTGQLNPDMVRDRLVLVGYTAAVAKDNVNTPYGEMPGVWVHSHMVSQLLSAALDQRPLIGKLPHWQNLPCLDGLWILGWSLLGSLFTSWLYNRPPLSFKLIIPLGLTFGLISLYWGLERVSVTAITQGLWLPFMSAIFSVLLAICCVAFMMELSKKHR
ncbi:CHASE2 domain-containing protein [Leptothoe sp. ISB3NOV94-8A]